MKIIIFIILFLLLFIIIIIIDMIIIKLFLYIKRRRKILAVNLSVCCVRLSCRN